MRILVVDDDPLVRQLLNAVLSMEGWSVELACSGEEGLAACRASPPDVVTLDYSMPTMSGLQVAERLLDDRFASPIIVFSAAHTPEMDQAATALGISAVPKTELDKLVEMIRHLVPPPAPGRRRLRGARRSA